MKILSEGAELFHAGGLTDRQTDNMKLIVAYRNFANAPEKKWWSKSDIQQGLSVNMWK